MSHQLVPAVQFPSGSARHRSKLTPLVQWDRFHYGSTGDLDEQTLHYTTGARTQTIFQSTISVRLQYSLFLTGPSRVSRSIEMVILSLHRASAPDVSILLPDAILIPIPVPVSVTIVQALQTCQPCQPWQPSGLMVVHLTLHFVRLINGAK